jgi:hypothetical protein
MTSAYTKKETKKLIEMYTENPCLEQVDKISVAINRTRKSIIAKLSKEGVYQKKGYVTKTGGVPITKLQIVRQIEDTLEIALPGLDKTPKDTLKKLALTIISLSKDFEALLVTSTNAAEAAKVAQEMLQQKLPKDYDQLATDIQDSYKNL